MSYGSLKALGHDIRIKNSERTRAHALTTSNTLSSSCVSGLEWLKRLNVSLPKSVPPVTMFFLYHRGTANCSRKSKTATAEKALCMHALLEFQSLGCGRCKPRALIGKCIKQLRLISRPSAFKVLRRIVCCVYMFIV